MWNEKSIGELVGQTLSRVANNDDEIVFESVEGKMWRLYHSQDCCEQVYVEDVAGDLEDLVGSEIIFAEEVDNEPEPVVTRDYQPESETWTFYKLGTIKGSVTIRWYGSSNGYYSERVSFEEM